MNVRFRPATAMVLLVTLACAGALPLESAADRRLPSKSSYPGQQGVFVPVRSDEGVWDGTWYYNSIECKIVIWLRTRRGKVEARARYQGLNRPIGFESDWKGTSAYYNAEQPSLFELKFSRTTPTDLDGTWKWDTRLANSSRNEAGTFTMFRALDGRTLVVEFKEYELVMISRDKTARITQAPTWTFIKASKREALWDELPF